MLSNQILVDGPAFTPFGRNLALFPGLSLLNMPPFNARLFGETTFFHGALKHIYCGDMKESTYIFNTTL